MFFQDAFLFPWRSSPTQAYMPPRYCSFCITFSHTHTPSRTSVNEWSTHCGGRYLRNTQQTQETNIHALSGFRTRSPRNRSAADLRPRPHRRGWLPSDLLALFLVSAVRIASYNNQTISQCGRVSQFFSSVTFTGLWFLILSSDADAIGVPRHYCPWCWHLAPPPFLFA